MKPRTKLLLDDVARKFGFYTAYELDSEEYVGTVEGMHVAERLRQRGYEASPSIAGITLEAAKLHPDTGNVHDVSLRKVDPDNPRKQWHVHIFNSGKVDAHGLAWPNARHKIFTHYEFRPDFTRVGDESYGDMIQRLRTHYRPEWGSDDYIRGKASPVVTELVNGE